MAQWLGALTALPGVLSSIPSTHMVANTQFWLHGNIQSSMQAHLLLSEVLSLD